MEQCSSCEHFEAAVDIEETHGSCLLSKNQSGEKPLDAAHPMVAEDAEINFAVLRVLPTFGCNQHAISPHGATRDEQQIDHPLQNKAMDKSDIRRPMSNEKMPDRHTLMKQAQKFQGEMQQAQEELAKMTCEGTAGGGLVTVTVNGQFKLVRLKVDRLAVDPNDVAMLEDLITAAFNAAVTKALETTMEKMDTAVNEARLLWTKQMQNIGP